MTIVYEKVMALKVPPVEVAYGPKDCMLYALGLGFGQDPMNEDELAFVYEKNLKVLPTMATVLGYGVSWAREAGIDQLRVAHRDGGWTPQAIAETMLPAFKSGFYALDRSQDVFNWEPL